MGSKKIAWKIFNCLLTSPSTILLSENLLHFFHIPQQSVNPYFIQIISVSKEYKGLST